MAKNILRGWVVFAAWALLCITQAAHVRLQGASVYVNEILVVTLRGGRNAERAKTVAASFQKLTENSVLTLSKVDKHTFQLLESDRVVITATRAEAKAQGMSAEVLAKTWQSRLEKAITASPLSISTDRLKLPEGGAGSIKLSGWRLSEAKLTTDKATVATVTRNGDTLKVQAKALGEAVITLQVGDIVKMARISVMPVAARFPQAYTVTVTGDPASSETVKAAVEGALWTRTQVHESAGYTFKLPDIGTLGYEQSRTYAVPVKATSESAFDAEGTINVIVRNEPIGYRAESELWYCNDPENVEKPGNLFAGRIKGGQAVRMLYHHINASSNGLIVQVNAVNESDKPARLLIIPGDSKPDKNPVLAGIVAGDQLLRNWIRFSGEVVTLPAKSSLPIAMRRLSPAETMSGLCYLMLIEGSQDITIRADAVPSFDGGARMAAAMQTASPWRRLGPMGLRQFSPDLKLSQHVYPWPFKNELVEFMVGGRHGFIRLGQKPIPNTTGGHLDGNFGVFYNIEANCENPNGDIAEVEVVFEASAGYSGALFVLNGEVLRTPLLQPKEEALITKFKLNPGEKRKFTMMSVPLSGSSYPATIVIRPVGTGSGPKPRDMLASGGLLR